MSDVTVRMVVRRATYVVQFYHVHASRLVTSYDTGYKRYLISFIYHLFAGNCSNDLKHINDLKHPNRGKNEKNDKIPVANIIPYLV